ncbi:DinB family protein [Chryseosolibacter indicus]|uniref:DinB family protein n=1 Tax=Chryseosolibacter indicus TaxID=2782351 RepID=A0ABS5VXG8_9BACT|nr:DinB family protein [Chryseosolibacter indicus]MBT1706104.1 DinB family protein [Chryseosolibacter indicus]
MKKLLPVFALFVVTHAFSQGQFQMESVGSLTFVSGHVKQLAAAIPAEKYAYKPQDGVRSIAEVCAHIISANYFFGSKLGAKIPTDVKMETIEKDLKTKDVIEKELTRSYEVLISAIKNTKDASLSSKVEFPFPGEFTNMTTILISLGHSNEHLGQLIAYARMNNVTPPWSETK